MLLDLSYQNGPSNSISLVYFEYGLAGGRHWQQLFLVVDFTMYYLNCLRSTHVLVLSVTL